MQREEYENKGRSAHARGEGSSGDGAVPQSPAARATVHVTRFDKAGRVVRVDLKKKVVIVNLGLGQWEIPMEEILPVKTA